jgi:proline iminopeptidase
VRVSAAAARFPVRRTGSGPPALLLHGGPGMDDGYLADFVDLMRDRLELLSYTQRGVAPSIAEGPYTIAQHVADACEVLDAAGLERAIVIGHSWGGHLAGQLTAAHPERVVAMVSVDGLGLVGDGGWDEFDAHFERALPGPVGERLMEMDRRLQAGGGTEEEAGEMLRATWPYYFADPPNAPAPPPFRLSNAVYAETSTEAKADLAAGRVTEALRGSAVPALFLRGGASGFPRDAVEASARLFRDGRYVEIEGAGHFTWAERPDATREAILAFLADVGALADEGRRAPIGAG